MNMNSLREREKQKMLLAVKEIVKVISMIVLQALEIRHTRHQRCAVFESKVD